MSKENAISKAKQDSANKVTIKAEDIQLFKNEIHAELEAMKQIVIQRTESFSGPLPHPEHFERYNQILPGASDRLLKMSEDDLKHIHNIQKTQISIERIAVIGGLIAAWTISIIALLGSGYLVLKGHDVSGSILGTGSLTSLVGVFIYGRKVQNNIKQ